MNQLDLLLELNGMISESLAARPEWADLRELLRRAAALDAASACRIKIFLNCPAVCVRPC